MMGLFAERCFSKEDYIGVYLGKFNKETDPHKGDYAYQLGNLDAETGLGGKPYMGMHNMNDLREQTCEGRAMLLDFRKGEHLTCIIDQSNFVRGLGGTC